MSFIFGGNTPLTYEQLQKKREIADALLAANLSTPQNVGEGLNAVGRALAFRGLSRKADKRDAELKGEFESQFASAFGGGAPGVAQSGPMYNPPAGPGLPIKPADPSNPEAIASDTMAALGKGATPEGIKAGLVARGMPEHIAEGFVMNFKDESGLNPGINEIAPLVPGSRGGFGLAQWTGPRRKALEAFAAEKGMPVSDPGVQMDFLMTELQGPEAAAWAKISGAGTSGEAAAAIVNNFLRPAEEHRSKREREYLSAGGAPATPASGMDLGTLASLAANPYATPGQKAVLEALIGQQTAAMDPMRNIELQKAQLELAQMQNPETKQNEYDLRAAEAAQYGLEPGTPEHQSFVLTGKLPDATVAGGTEYGTTLQFYTDPKDGKLKAGVIGKDGTFKDVAPPGGGEWAQGVDKVDAGTKWLFYDKRTGEKVGEEPKDLRGAEADKALGQAEGEAAGDAVTGLSNALAKGEQALALIDGISNDPALPSILGIVQGNIPAGTPVIGGGQAGADLNAKIEQLQGQVFLEAFESLKGAGQITEIEGQKAERAKARLQRSQSPEAYKAALMELREVIEGGMNRARQKAAKVDGGSSQELSDEELLKLYGGE